VRTGGQGQVGQHRPVVGILGYLIPAAAMTQTRRSSTTTVRLSSVARTSRAAVMRQASAGSAVTSPSQRSTTFRRATVKP
jgi:hypothetical protein